jgi:DNA-binding SARP family transcriptional activator
MEVRLLGPLGAEVRGVSIVPSAAKPRQVLALLAVYANQVLPVSTIMEEIWSERPPRSALTTLQTYVLQLRRRLGHALGPDSPYEPKDVLATRHGGYLLELQPGAVDIQEFDRLVLAGQHALDSADDEMASALYTEALALHRGPALVDVRNGPVLEIEATRLDQSRLLAVERRNEADLRLGRHARMLSELTQLTVRYPLHEAFHAQFMLALCQAGQRWRALETYQQLRRRLIDELGLEPSPRVRRLQQAVLNADPTLELYAGHRGPVLDLFVA